MANHSIVPVSLAVKAMRDNGYKNAAYAIAELIDNSIQAGATSIELICAEDEFQANLKVMKRVTNIAVLDNGKGMDSATLRMALQFGNGTNLTPDKQDGIGKFGMGLPSASISQAKKVEVWTWQNDKAEALYSYLDLDEIISGNLEDVPEPINKPIPSKWLNASDAIGSHGTLVVWSNIDKCIWKTSNAIFKNSEFVIGRMYRYYIEDNSVKIQMKSFQNNNTNLLLYEGKYAQANDPLYLMSKTSCPAPYDNKPMFREFPDVHEFVFEYPVNFNGQTYGVKVKLSIAKEEARVDRHAGSLPYGKHAAKNIGVSLVRANRELHLDDSLCLKYNPTERWWGVEVSFPPALDDIFGVTNNKQYANNFSELANYDIKDFADDEYGFTFQELKETLEEEEDPKAKIISLVNKINEQIKLMRIILKQQGLNKGQGGKNIRHTNIQTPEESATASTEKRKDEAHLGTSDEQEEKMAPGEKIEAVREELEENNVSEADQDEIIDILFNRECGIKYQFLNGDFDGNAFFSVKPKGGKIIITLNMEHPAYKNLIEVLDDTCEECSKEDLQERLRGASDGLKLLLMAWARYEDEEPDGPRKKAVQNARQDWGKIAYDFLKKNN